MSKFKTPSEEKSDVHSWRFYQDAVSSHGVHYVYLPEYAGWWNNVIHVVCDVQALTLEDAKDTARMLDTLSIDLRRLLRNTKKETSNGG